MKTEIDRQYYWGFLLSEQDLRRLVQSCEEHANKLGATNSTRIAAKLKDGSLVETESLDGVLTLENGGQKAVTRLVLQWSSAEIVPKASVKVQFENGLLNQKSWVSVSFSVVGESRDSVFVAASDLDDRVKKTRTRSWPYITSRRWFTILPFFLGLIISLLLTDRISPSGHAVDQLEAAYRAGRLANPIEAMILLERLKTTRTVWQTLSVTAVPFLAPVLAFGLIAALSSKLTFSYVFYWGDAIAIYDKRQSLAKVFWGVLVLGVIASVIAGIILHAFHW